MKFYVHRPMSRGSGSNGPPGTSVKSVRRYGGSTRRWWRRSCSPSSLNAYPQRLLHPHPRLRGTTQPTMTGRTKLSDRVRHTTAGGRHVGNLQRGDEPARTNRCCLNSTPAGLARTPARVGINSSPASNSACNLTQ
jgi:hypothetical protein